MPKLLEIQQASIQVGSKLVLQELDLEIAEAELHALMGPNACGKTSLAMAILGHPHYKLIQGKLRFRNQDLAQLPMDARARLGIGICYQHPPTIKGLKLRELIRAIRNAEPWNPILEPQESIASPYLAKVGLDPSFLGREVNLGFSGGERKRAELAQMLAMQPKLFILDEIDSGVDIDSLKQIAMLIQEYLDQTRSSGLIITHYRHILEHLHPHQVHLMYHGGKLIDSGAPERILPKLESLGYEGYARSLGMIHG